MGSKSRNCLGSWPLSLLSVSSLLSFLLVTGEGMNVTSERPGAAVSDESPWAWEHCRGDAPEKPRS